MGTGSRGVIPRGNSILISFTYKGERFRDTLKLKPTSYNLNIATKLREKILSDITFNKFNYLEYFPNGTKCNQFINSDSKQLTIKSALQSWIRTQERKLQPSTLKDYNSAIYHHLIPYFGELTLNEFSEEHIEEWRSDIPIKNKRINNVLIPLRGVFALKQSQGVLKRNLFNTFKNLPVETREPEPFNNNEIDIILSVLNGQDKNLIQFAFFSGLRTSELIALKWDDIDFNKNTVYVCRAKVLGQIKTTKTKTGTRTVRLQHKALQALLSQLPHTNKDKFVFHDAKTRLPWKDDQAIRKRVWKKALSRADIKYREPYQTRHTFCSMLLSNGAPPLWVSEQMGHKNCAFTYRVYSRYIPINEDNLFL